MTRRIAGLNIPALMACALLLWLGSAAALLWGQAPASPAQDDDEQSRRLELKFARSLSKPPDEEKYYLRGNVHYSRKDVDLYCDESVYDKRADTGTARGNLKVITREATITGDLISIDFGAEIITVSGNVVMIAQKKRENDTAADGGAGSEEKADNDSLSQYRYKKTTVTCDRIEYHYADAKKTAYLRPPQGAQLKAVQEDKTALADAATYRELEDVLDVEGNVRVVTEAGEEFRCPAARLFLSDDSMEAQNVTGLVIRRKPEPAAGGQPTAPPPASPAAPPPAQAQQ